MTTLRPVKSYISICIKKTFIRKLLYLLGVMLIDIVEKVHFPGVMAKYLMLEKEKLSRI